MPFIKYSNLKILLKEIKSLYKIIEEISKSKDSLTKDISKKFTLCVLYEVICSLLSNLFYNNLKPNETKQITQSEFSKKIKFSLCINNTMSIEQLGIIRNSISHNFSNMLDKEYKSIINPINKDELLNIVKLSLDKIDATEEHYLLLDCINIIFDNYNRRDIINPIDLLKETSNNL